jgi:DNA helicase HerA-like ATPase
MAVLGTTGSGKSCAVALILKSILSRHNDGHVVLLDSHNEYASAFGEIAELVTPEDLQIPYWLMNFEESLSIMTSGSSETYDVEAAILKNAILESRRKYGGNGPVTEGVTVDTPVPYRLTDLVRYIDMKMGELDKPSTSIPYLRLKSRIEDLSTDKRLAFMFPGHHLRDNMVEILSRLLRMPVNGRPLTILDLSGLPAEILDVIVSVVCRMIFDFAVWSDQSQMEPILLICEEAHRYIPESENAGFGPTKRIVSRIAKEGRKYGVSLCLVSQRPSELSMAVLSQCNTIFALRMSNERDHEFVRNALPDNAQGFMGALPTLGTQEAIVIGEGVTVPTRLRFDKLPQDQQPRSRTAKFSDAWQRGHADPDSVAQTVSRWRQRVR